MRQIWAKLWPGPETYWRRHPSAAKSAGSLSSTQGNGSRRNRKLLHMLTQAARTSDPADVLDSLITRYAEAGGGRVSVTPQPLADLMAAIGAPGHGIVLDPACGTGELLAAAARHGATGLFGQELDDSLARLAGIRLAISDREFASRVSAGDSLRDESSQTLRRMSCCAIRRSASGGGAMRNLRWTRAGSTALRRRPNPSSPGRSTPSLIFVPAAAPCW